MSLFSRIFKRSLFGFGLFCGTSAAASHLSLSVGSPAFGSGGPNAVAIPPRAANFGISYLNESDTEFQLNLIGIGVGKREIMAWGGFYSLGGTLALSSNGAGFGIYSNLGYEFLRTDGGYSGSIEWLQSIGLASKSIISPYVLRFGVGKWF